MKPTFTINMTKKVYTCKFDWYTDTEAKYEHARYRIQASEGFYLENGKFNNAFIEVFPNNPQTFIRGEGKTIEEAEAEAWLIYQRVSNCEEHIITRYHPKLGKYKNGVGFCKLCGLYMSGAFKAIE